MRYRGYAGLPVQMARAGRPMACPMLARPQPPAAPQTETDKPEPARPQALHPAGQPESPPVPSPSPSPARSDVDWSNDAAGESPATASEAAADDRPDTGKPDASHPGLPPLDNTPPPPAGRRQRMILMLCAAAVTIGTGAAIALLMEEASTPLRLGTVTPAVPQSSGASGAAPGHSGGGAAVDAGVSAPGAGVSSIEAGAAAADAACPLAGGAAACPAMVAIPAGRYRPGSLRNDPDAQQEEYGGAERVIAAFELSAHEVTAGQWQQCVNDQACPPPAQPAESSAMPVTGISWDAAAAYAAWLSHKTGRQYRLPTEAEWEYAARAGAATPFPWGDRLGQRNAHCGQCGVLPGFPRFAPVGSYPARRGLYDMVGNAYEWVADCWTASHAQPLPPASAVCRDKVQKGGAFDTLEADVRPVARTYGDRSAADPRVGFRVARALAASAPEPMSMQTTEQAQRSTTPASRPELAKHRKLGLTRSSAPDAFNPGFIAE